MAVAVDALERVVSEMVSPNAGAVDANGEFPMKSLDALQANGLIGLTTGSDVGGGGGSMADAAIVVEKLAGACGSTAMVVLMHFAANAIIEAHGSEEVRRDIGA